MKKYKQKKDITYIGCTAPTASSEIHRLRLKSFLYMKVENKWVGLPF